MVVKSSGFQNSSQLPTSPAEARGASSGGVSIAATPELLAAVRKAEAAAAAKAALRPSGSNQPGGLVANILNKTLDYMRSRS